MLKFDQEFAEEKNVKSTMDHNRMISLHHKTRSTSILLSSSEFSLFGVGASSFQYLRSQVLCLYIFSFMFFLISSLHLSFGLPIFRCPPTYMLSLLHLLQSFSPHGLTISVSLRLFSNVCLPHLISSFLISIFFITIILLNILISVPSSKFCSAFLIAQVSLTYIRFYHAEQINKVAHDQIVCIIRHSFPYLFA